LCIHLQASGATILCLHWVFIVFYSINNKFAFGCFWYLLTFCFFAFCSVKKFDPITWCSAWQPDNADLGEKNVSHLLRVDRASDHLVRHARAPEAGDAWLEVIRIIAENLTKEYRHQNRRHTTSKKTAEKTALPGCQCFWDEFQ